MAAPTSFNITVDDSSPTIAYAPAVVAPPDTTPDLAAGWNQFFNGTASTAPGQVGAGQSVHVTERANASFTLQFTGECLPG